MEKQVFKKVLLSTICLLFAGVTMYSWTHIPSTQAADTVAEGMFGTAGYGGNSNKCWWGLYSDGLLEIRPQNAANNSGGCLLSKWYDANSSSRSDKSQIADTMYQWPWLRYKDSVVKVKIHRKFYTDGDLKLSKMFRDYPNLEEVDTSGIEVASASDQEGQSFFSKVTEADEMFANCPKLEKVDLSGFRNNGTLWSMKRMFANDPKLRVVILNNAGFKTRASSSNGVMMQGFFYGSDNLETVDMSNITVGGWQTATTYTLGFSGYTLPDGDFPNLTKRYTSGDINTTAWSDYVGFDNLFLNKTKLTTVKLVNTKVTGMRGFASMFENCTSLKEWDGEKGLNMDGFLPTDATDMRNMFKNTGFTNLDVSSFGKLSSIVNMDGFVENISSLKTLTLDNLDNSNIGPYSKNHSIAKSSANKYPAKLYTKTYEDADVVSEADSMTTGATEYGREIFGKGVYDIKVAFPNLTTVSAKNSNVWLVKNNNGTGGNLYYNGSNDSDVVYLSFADERVINFTPDGGSELVFDTKRDWIDMIIDRDGNTNYTYAPAVDPLPDAETNLNILNDYNPNGAGHLAPGVYTITDNTWSEAAIEFPNTYYRVAYIGSVPFRVEGIADDDPELILVHGATQSWVNTKTKTDWPTTGNYTIDRSSSPITITYEDAAIDVNGKKHDVVITITKITFKNFERIPTRDTSRIHDSNRYIDFHPTSAGNANNQSQWTTTNIGYYRTILRATRDEGISFKNYVRYGAGNITPWDEEADWNLLSGGSGTDIEFTVKIDGANDGTTFIFNSDDLDVAEVQNWNHPSIDADYDNLPKNQITYGLGGEGFILGSGNELNTVTFADETGLKLVDGNKIISTGSDPDTSWSEFAVKANAQGSNYIWTSGVGCTSIVMRNTEKINLGAMEIEPVAKVLAGGTLADGQFEFTLTPDDSVADNQATGSAVVSTNHADGNVTFGAFEFNSPLVNIDGLDYYPGTVNDTTNTHGNGAHIAYTYAWTIQESDGGDPNIIYDTAVKRLKIVISTPENDLEMEKGIKAEIYVDDVLVSTQWSKDVESNKYTADVVFTNIVLKDITLQKIWDDAEDSSKRPENIEGYLDYTHDIQGNKRIEADSWTKDEYTWTFTTKIPANAIVVDWGESEVPDGYELSNKEHQDNTEVYIMTNILKRSEPEPIPTPTPDPTPTPTPNPTPDPEPEPETSVPDTGSWLSQNGSAIAAGFALPILLISGSYVAQRLASRLERNKNKK